MCKTNQQNLVQFWKSYYGPNISQTTAAKLLYFLYVFKTTERKIRMNIEITADNANFFETSYLSVGRYRAR